MFIDFHENLFVRATRLNSKYDELEFFTNKFFTKWFLVASRDRVLLLSLFIGLSAFLSLTRRGESEVKKLN